MTRYFFCIPRRLLGTLVLLLVACVCAPAAHAAETYTSSKIGCTSYQWGSGSADAAGTTYASCGFRLLRYRSDGLRLPDVLLPDQTTDVAPSPTGEFVYTFFGDEVRRLNRTAGTYVMDATWRLSSFTIGGISYLVRGRYLAVDAWGDIYVSNGGWYVGAPSVILKYAPDGTFITSIGEWGLGTGQFNTNMGLSVTRDGSSIYTTENITGRIQRFDWNGRKYAFAATFGTTDTNCAATGAFAAPYDIGIDAWNYLYIADTSCRRIQKFTSRGEFVGVVAKLLPTDTLAHGIAVSPDGNFLVAQWGLWYRRASTNPVPGPYPGIAPLPGPDVTAPVIADVQVPKITLQRSVDLTIVASDVGRGITDIRLANEDGIWGAWKPFNAKVTQPVTAGYGAKGVSVQVRDLDGNESLVVYRTFQYASALPAPPDTTAPVLQSVTMPDSTTTPIIDLTMSATDNVGVAQYRTAAADGVWGAWLPYAATVSYMIPSPLGRAGVFVQVRDAAGNESGSIFRYVSYVSAAPADLADPVLTGVAGPAVTAQQRIDLSIDAADDVKVTRVRLANEDGVWGAWTTFAPTIPTVLSAGYGPKVVFVQVGDAAGRESTVATLRVSYQADAALPLAAGPADSAAPVLVDVVVPAQSESQRIDVNMTASDNVGVAQARFASEDGVWGPWSPYTPTMPFMLSAGFTYKLVSVQVRDAAGNESNVVVRKTQYVRSASGGGIQDISDPIIRSVAVPATVGGQLVTIDIDASDDVGVFEVRLANEDGVWSAWKPFAPSVQHQLTAGATQKVVFVQVRDAVGHESNVVLARTLVQ